MIHEVEFISHPLLWTGAVKRTKALRLTLFQTVWKRHSLLSCLLEHHFPPTFHRIPATGSQLFIYLLKSVRPIIREPQTVLNKSYHTTLCSPYHRLRDLRPQEVEQCCKTADWLMLIASQTWAAVDITAHLFPATAKHRHLWHTWYTTA